MGRILGGKAARKLRLKDARRVGQTEGLPSRGKLEAAVEVRRESVEFFATVRDDQQATTRAK